MNTDREIQIAVDAETHRPGCILIQATVAVGEYRDVIFDYSDIWILSPTKNMIVLKGKESEARQLFDLVRTKMKAKKDKKK